MQMSASPEIELAAAWIQDAEALFITSGAGMGVASGLGTFRGVNAGIWPPLEKMGKEFPYMSNPTRFQEDPAFAWSFWNFRYTNYTRAEPHEGYGIIKQWCDSKPMGGFSFTSNIDGHWLQAGFREDQVLECHGTLRYMQCQGRTQDCPYKEKIWPANNESILNMQIDPETDRVTSALPRCPGCDNPSRPNVLMFGDFYWQPDRNFVQEKNYKAWLNSITGKKVVVVEVGAGVAIPTVRWKSESVSKKFNAPLIRINPEYPEIDELPTPHVSIQEGGLEAILALNEVIRANA